MFHKKRTKKNKTKKNKTKKKTGEKHGEVMMGG